VEKVKTKMRAEDIKKAANLVLSYKKERDAESTDDKKNSETSAKNYSRGEINDKNGEPKE